MPFALLIIGAVLLIAAVRNTQSDLFTLVQGDFTGQNNYIFWVVAILIIGAVGYIKPLKPLSTAFLALVILVLFLSRGAGLFSRFTSGIASTQTPAPVSTSPASTTAAPGGIPGLPSLPSLIINNFQGAH